MQTVVEPTRSSGRLRSSTSGTGISRLSPLWASPDVAAHRWLLAGIVLCSASVDLFFFSGFYASDDVEYLSGAREILTTGRLPAEPMLGQKRLTLVGWNLLVALVFGYRVQVIAASYILFHLLLVVLTYRLGRRLFDATVGVVAAWLTALFPCIVVFSSQILPDILLTCAMLSSLLAFVWAYELRAAGRTGASLWAMAGSGAAVGLAYLTKEAGLVLAPFYFVLWLLCERGQGWRRGVRTGLAFAAGLAAVIVLEWAALSMLTGSPFFRLGWTFETEKLPDWLQTKLENRARPMERLAWLLREANPLLYPRSYLILFGLGFLAYPLMRGRMRLAAWFMCAWIAVYFTFGTMSLSRYLPPSIQARYYIPIVPLLSLMAAALLISVGRWVAAMWNRSTATRVVRLAGVAGLAALPATTLAGPDALAGNSYWSHLIGNTLSAITFAAGQSGRPIVVSSTLSRYLGEMFYSELPRRALDAARLNDGDLDELVGGGGFYYIEADPESRQVRRTQDEPEVDAILHDAMWEDVPSARFVIEHLGDFNSVSRWQTIAARLFHSLPPTWPPARSGVADPELASIKVSAATRYQSPLSGVVGVYFVRPTRLLGTGEPERFMLGRGRAVDISPRLVESADAVRLDGWRVAAGGCELSPREDQLALFRLAAAAGEPVLVEPGESMRADALSIPPRRTCMIRVEPVIRGQVTVELLAALLSAAEDETTAAPRRFSLEDGVVRNVCVETRDVSRTIALKISASGAGEFALRVRLFSVPVATEMAETLYLMSSRDVTVQDLGPAPVAADETEAALAGWRVQKTEEYQVRPHDGEEWLAFDMAPAAYAWLVPTQQRTREHLRFAARQRALVFVSGSVRDEASAELRGFAYTDDAPDRRIGESRIHLKRDGAGVFTVQTGERPLSIRPHFKLIGSGRFRVEGLCVLTVSTDAIFSD